MQNLKKKTDLWFGKWPEEFDKFSTRAHKILTIGTFIGSFYTIRKYASLKLNGELCVMTMNNDAKFEIELICHFNIDMRNLTNFDPRTQKSQKFAF